jgi:rubrerythrin
MRAQGIDGREQKPETVTRAQGDWADARPEESASEETEGTDVEAGRDDDELASDEMDDSDLNLLVALAEMEAEVAEAYRIAAEHTDEVHFRTKLEEFRGDHLRHLERINDLLDDAGVAEVSTELDEQSSAITMLAASMGVMGVRASLLTMWSNESLTHATYKAVLELPFLDDVGRLLEEHLADEQRHIEWLTEQQAHVAPDDDQVESEDAEADD